MQYKTSNPIDIFGLKRNIVANYDAWVRAMQREFRGLTESSLPPAKCPICASEYSTLLMVVHGVRWRQCSRCTHVFHSEPISDERLMHLYTDVASEFAYSHTYSKDPAIQQIRLESAATRKVEYISSFLAADDGRHQGRWLDIACGNGDFLGVAKSRGYDVLGIELSGELVDIARTAHGVPVFHGTLPEYCDAHPAEKFDVVAFVGIIGALRDPMEYLRLASEMTSDSGLLAVNAHHVNSLSAALAEAYPAQVIRYATPDQFHLFTEQSLQAALRKNGFEPLGVWYYGMDIYELINTLAFESSHFRASKAREILTRLVNELQHVIDAARLCDEMMVVARKMRRLST